MSFPRYAEYKDSGVEWLGNVPTHWTVLPLKSLARFAGGGTPSRDNLAFWGGNIPWISPKDMKRERIASAEETITEEGLAESTASLVERGRVLIVVRSGILKHTIPVAINEAPVALNQDMKALEFSPGCCVPDFFLRWVQGLNDRLILAWAKQGATVESIEHAYLANTLIPLPPLDEQRAIADFLDRETTKIDALVAEQERLIALLKEKRQAVISHAVTKGLNPDAPMKESGFGFIGEIPSTWSVVKLGDLAASVSTGPFGTSICADDYVTGGVPIINPSHICDGALVPEDHVTASVGTALTLARWRLQPGDIVVARRGEIGRCGLVSEQQDGWICGTGCLFVRSNQHLAASPFLCVSIGSDYSRAWLEQWSVGSTMANLNEKLLAALPICVPATLHEQELLVSKLEARLAEMHQLIDTAIRAVLVLSERRAALITAAVTGQIDVRDLTPAEAA